MIASPSIYVKTKKKGIRLPRPISKRGYHFKEPERTKSMVMRKMKPKKLVTMNSREISPQYTVSTNGIDYVVKQPLLPIRKPRFTQM